MRRKPNTLLLSLVLICLMAVPARADEDGFLNWLYGFRQRAAAAGINQNYLNTAVGNLEYLPRVIELDRKQPEHKITFAKYKKNVLPQSRIDEGRERMAQYRGLLESVSRRYGVPPQYIVALWGMETSYGRVTGGFDTLSSLATLAYEGRRAEFFEKELINLMKIVQEGHVGEPVGSWAGAMGQTQFMPSSYLKYAEDADGDGHADIWGSMPDVFASIANYLHTEGWQDDLRWGRAVTAPRSIPESAYGRDKMRPLSYWRRMGVTQTSGAPLPTPEDGSDPMAGLVAPDGYGTPTYLVYENYNVIMHWNKSTYFATSVGLLADALASSRP